MKLYTVYVHYWPANEGHKEMWLGYTTYMRSKSCVGQFDIEAETRAKAITKAINKCKEQIALENEKSNSREVTNKEKVCK